MTMPWFEVVAAEAKITQGDFISDCPLLAWKRGITHTDSKAEQDFNLQEWLGGLRADVIVMTQACDLEHNKVRDVVLCPHVALSEFRKSWEQAVKDSGQHPTAKAWRRTCQDIASGHVWNQSFLNLFDGEDIQSEIRVVHFHRVFTAPRDFLETFARVRGEQRLRLLPPYREHLSQAFARFFMRVGLPQPVDVEISR